MVFVLVKGTDALTVNEKDLKLLPLPLSLEGLAPEPEALRAGVDCGPDTKAHVASVDDHSVEEERLARSVLAGDSDHPHLFLDATEKVLGLF